jgi:hypothetical protein
VSSRANSNDENLLLDIDDVPPFVMPHERTIDSIDKFIPSWIDLPYVKAVLATFEELRIQEEKLNPQERLQSIQEVA